MFMTGSRQRIKSPTVERFFSTDNLILAGILANAVFTCQLHGAFVGFRATVSEEHPVKASDFTDQLHSFSLNIGIKDIGAVGQLGCLLAQSLYQHRMGITQSVNGDTAQKVQIGFTFSIVQITTLTVGKSNLI